MGQHDHEDLAEGGGKRAAERILEIITEDDPFRLVIRGHALMEETIDGAIGAAFPGGTPAELRRLGFRSRLALARGLELVDDQVSLAIETLAKIRNEFAHGSAEKLTDRHRSDLVRVVQSFLPEGVDTDQIPRETIHRIAVGLIWQATRSTIDHALEVRAEAEQALASWRAAADEYERYLFDTDNLSK